MPTHAAYAISVATELTGTHLQTLNIHEREGLVVPAGTNSSARRYADDGIDKIAKVKKLTAQGVNLAEVQIILALSSERDTLTVKLHRRRDLPPGRT